MALLRGYLYVIADKERQFVKIGMARDVSSRFQQLQSSCPLSLELVSSHPCTYARFRELLIHKALWDLHLQNEWFRWDEARTQGAIAKAMAIPDDIAKSTLEKHLTQSHDYEFAVKRMDTEEVFPTTRAAALAVLGSEKLAAKIKKAVKAGVKCGPTYWTKI